MLNYKSTPSAAIIEAIEAAQTPNELDDAKYLFFCENETVKAITAQVMSLLVKDQIIDGRDTVSSFSAVYIEVQDVISKTLLMQGPKLADVMETAAALRAWHTAPAKPAQYSAQAEYSPAELRLIAHARAAQSITVQAYEGADKLATQEMKAVCPMEDDTETYESVTPEELYVLARYRAAIEASDVDSMTPAEFATYAAQNDQEFASWILQSEPTAPSLYAEGFTHNMSLTKRDAD